LGERVLLFFSLLGCDYDMCVRVKLINNLTLVVSSLSLTRTSP
jgi:hypothetical protein